MLELPRASRIALWKKTFDAVEALAEDLEKLPVSPSMDPKLPRVLLSQVDFDRPMDPEAALALAVEGLRHHQVHNGHPRYFGLFNPATTTMSIAADTLVAAFNPQLAAWTHAPFACEVDQMLIREIGARFGYARETCSGSFTSGGAEANHTALLMALVRRFPRFGEDGARTLDGRPLVYVSPESHHSFVKAARLTGIGTHAVRHVVLDERYVVDPSALQNQIAKDRANGDIPLLVVATLGTTGAGLIDPVGAIAKVGHEEGVWVHADAAWGGAAALLPEMRQTLSGIEQADSITFDAHKWLSVPMGAGMFFTRHPDMAERTFSIDAGYMPRAKDGVEIVEPHRSSMQWTRRFIGLKLFLSLLVAGWEGYEQTIREMVRLGGVLRKKLEAAGFALVNQTPLPVACFQDASHPEGRELSYLKAMAESVIASGKTWISIMSLGDTTPALRACITNFRNREEDIDALIELLMDARDRAS